MTCASRLRFAKAIQSVLSINRERRKGFRFLTKRMSSTGISPPSPDSSSAPTSVYRPASVSSTLIEEWDEYQRQLRKRIIKCDTEAWQQSDTLSGLERVGGVDVSVRTADHSADECEAYAAVVICNFPTMEVIHQETEKIHLSVPYVPGYLAFRESSPAVTLMERIIKNHPDKVPDVLLIDGNGLLHPQMCGLACHIGVQTSIPTIGVAKNLHLISGLNITKRQETQGLDAVGDNVLLKDSTNQTIGMALKTGGAKKPIYISIGHKVSLETARKVVLQSCKHRVPEPIRFADFISREQIRKLENLEKEEKKDSVLV